MWLKVNHTDLKKPVHVVVSADGQLFFRALDLAKNFNSPNRFASTCATIADIVYKKIRDLDRTTLKTRVVQLQDLEVYFSTDRRFKLLKSIFEGDEFRVVIGTYFSRSTKKKDAAVMHVSSDPKYCDDPPVKNFVKKFTQQALEFYNLNSAKVEMEACSEKAPHVLRVVFCDGVEMLYKRM